MEIKTNWITLKDIPRILEIEKLCYPSDPWSEEIFKNCLKQENCVGVVAFADDKILGYNIFEIYKNHKTILNIAVDPEWKKLGIGKKLIDAIKDNVKNIHTVVSEKNLLAHLFLQKNGFIATKVEREFFDKTEDAYRFEYNVKVPFYIKKRFDTKLLEKS